MRQSAVLTIAVLLAGCATDAPAAPSPYLPTVKPVRSTLAFTDDQNCQMLRADFERTQNWKGYAAKQVVALHDELFPTAILMLGVNVMAFNQMSDSLAKAREDLIAIRDEMLKDGCENVPEVIFSTPSARTPGSIYH